MTQILESRADLAKEVTTIGRFIAPATPSAGGSKVPQNPDVWLSRADTAAALTELGLDTPKATLATLAARGRGPAFTVWGRSARYRWRDVIEWAEQRLAARHRNPAARAAAEASA